MKRTTPRLLLAILLSAAMTGCNAIVQPKSIPAVTQSQAYPPPADLRDFRYCEVIPVFQTRLTFKVEVYNTTGLNDCPAELWAQLDAESMANAYGAKVVKLNGPRYWMMNQIMGGGATAAGKIVDFGGLEMKLLAVLETKLWEGTVGDAFYTPNEVQRTTTFSYWAGTMVYELISPEGDVYRMQSYSQIVDPTLTIADLATLGARLALPEGWRYAARILAEASDLKADGLAYVINDDLLNSYQKVLAGNAARPDVRGSTQGIEQPGYRASLYGTTWPVDMANLNRSNTVVNAGLPQGFTCEAVRVETVEMPFPVFAYTRDIDEVFVLGGLPNVLEDYVSEIDGLPAGSSPVEPHLTNYNPQTGATIQLDLDRGNGFAYIGGALIHENGYVYVVSQAYIYKINPDTMTIAAGKELPRAPIPGRSTTIYNGLSTSSSGHLLTKFFSGIGDASTFFIIDEESLELVASIDYPGASPRLTVDRLANGEEYLYHLNRFNTFRFKIGQDKLTLDEAWISRFDPYATGEEENEEPTSPVITNGRVHYTTNTKIDATEPMRIFWQTTEADYTPNDPPLSGEELLPGSDRPGWSFFHLAIDDIAGTIVAVDQGAGALVAVKILEDGTLEHLWQKPYTVSARPVIVSDREQVYATDYANGRNHLVVLDLPSGEELCRVATPATRATVATIIVSAANEVYFGSNEPGEESGLFHRFYIP